MKSNTITALCLACLAVLAAGLVFLTVTSTREAIPTAASAAHNWYYKPSRMADSPPSPTMRRFFKIIPTSASGMRKKRSST